MKLQYLAVIFVVIIVPIAIVMSQYLQTQIDTIVLQTAYAKSLDNATYDASKAFQINSINNKFSSISSSKIRDIEASINTFYNSLGTAMDMYISSKENLSSFVPAVLFTLYDGYYIHSSYENSYSENSYSEILNKVYIDDDGDYTKGLLPYVYYSAKYKLNNLNNGNIIVVNYTLDNAITVYGDIDGTGYKTRTGYLIDLSKIENINEGAKTLTYDGIEIGPETLREHLITYDDNGTRQEGDYEYIVYKNQKVYKEDSMVYFWYNNYKKTYLKSEKAELDKYIDENGVGFKSISAFEYFSNAKNFTEEILMSSMIDLTEDDIVDSKLSVKTGNEAIFKVGKDNDPLLSSSTFNTHRVAVIRNSIETNLSTALANYASSLNAYEFKLPVIDEENWYNIANNVSIVSFMQGIPIGMKYYNDYSVIVNTKNKEVINEQTIYLINQNGTEREYHQPGCEYLIKNNSGNLEAYNILSFQRQTAQSDTGEVAYFYSQARNMKKLTGCYNCIVNASAEFDIDDIIKGEIKDSEGRTIYGNNDLENIRKAYITALARERYDIYKSNFDLND